MHNRIKNIIQVVERHHRLRHLQQNRRDVGFLLAGFSPVLDFFKGWAPSWIIEAISSFSFLSRFEGLGKGVVSLRDLVFFVSLIGVFLYAAGIVIEMKKAE